jgi:hypothetical protein
VKPEQIEEQFRKLKEDVEAGTVSEDEFEAELRNFLFQDDSGIYWTIGAQTEKWYRHQAGDWVEASPPPELERSERQEKYSEAESTPIPSAPRRRLSARLAVGIVGLLVVACLILVATVSYGLGRGLLPTRPTSDSSMPASSPTETVVPEPTATAISGAVTASPEDASSPSPLATIATETPTLMPSATSTPLPEPSATREPPPAITHPAPVLLEPEDGAERGRGYLAILIWEPVDNLGDDEYYHVDICWNQCTVPWGAYVREATYTFPDFLRGEATDGSYSWHVTVRSQRGEAPEGPLDPATSPPSETRVFFLPE